MIDVDIDKLIQAWGSLQGSTLKQKEDDENFWAFEIVDELVQVDPERCWQFIVMAIEKFDDDWIIDNIAAGPIEDLLGQHGDKIIVWIEKRAKKNRKFRKVLGGVWRGDMSEEVWARLQAAAQIRS